MRRPVVLSQEELDNCELSEEDLEEWLVNSQVTLGPLLPESLRLKVLKLLYKYRHLDGGSLDNLPCTDLIVHKANLKPGTKPHSVKSQKRYALIHEWWMRKLVKEGVKGGIYESTLAANGSLSPWNARVVLVPKDADGKPDDEPRLAFNYHCIPEVLPGTHMELAGRVHDYLSDPRHKVFFTADLKHAYFLISLEPSHRKYYAFTIPGMGQLQPTRMPQGSASSVFTMGELTNILLGPIPAPNPSNSLLHAHSSDRLPRVTAYMDDLYGGLQTPEELYEFLRDELFPRIEWAKLKLSFKKLKLFVEQAKALGIIHEVGGAITILPDRVKKIAKWPTPSTQTDVRSFLGSLGISRRWITNFAEIARPLTRLTGRVEFRWTDAEKLSFELLKIKGATTAASFGIEWDEVIHFYLDSSGFARGLAITQFRKDPRDPSKVIEAPILYDSVVLSPTERKYGTYKKELLAIVKFTEKYSFYCQNPQLPTIIHTDHKPLTSFLKGDSHEGIYARWVEKLRALSIEIRYIAGTRNKVADALSRTIFDEECNTTPLVEDLLKNVTEKGAPWVWKDGKGGFQEYLDTYPDSPQALDCNNLRIAPDSMVKDWDRAYRISAWFGDIYSFLQAEGGEPPAEAWKFEIKDGFLYKKDERTGLDLLCVPEAKVRQVLIQNHDQKGHWGAKATAMRFVRRIWWPKLSSDVKDWIKGCPTCARYATYPSTVPPNPIIPNTPFRILGMDFIGPLPETHLQNRFILNIIDYFTSFPIAFAVPRQLPEYVVTCLERMLQILPRPDIIEFYLDPGSPFVSQILKDWAKRYGIIINFRPTGSSKSTGKIENANRWLQEVLMKTTMIPEQQWDIALPDALEILRKRIIGYLGFAPAELALGILGDSNLNLAEEDILKVAANPLPGVAPNLSEQELSSLRDYHPSEVSSVTAYMAHRAEIERVAYEDHQRTKNKERIKKKIRSFENGQLVMLKEKNRNKLAKRWRGPFTIEGKTSPRGYSYWITHPQGGRFPFKIHVDYLKAFTPRTSYLNPENIDDSLWTKKDTSIRRPNLLRRRVVQIND